MVLPSHYWTGPLAALFALAVVVLICRWVFAPPRRVVRPEVPGRPADYGLLVPVAHARSVDDADLLVAALSAGGVRSTVAPGDGGGWRVLVFSSDAERAERLVRR
ncbi:MAG TPA: hypothetical protein VNU26_17080 [Mycobacteriales bacterium]|nr:hypothetical protein [Mycobacteriales bacterium]